VPQSAPKTRTALFAGAPALQLRRTTPFLKWAGGKSELLPELLRRLPRSFNTYWEPFLGGGALFFSLNPVSAVLSDLNEELVNCYEVVKTDVDALLTQLDKHRNTRTHFMETRKLQPWTLDRVSRAARLIFLNKTCFNGLYRVNQKGEFNVPFGKYTNPNFCDERSLRAASRALKNTEILYRDFRFLLYRAQPGDFVYLDPPYDPVSSTSSFTSYSESPFGEREQKALRAVFEALAERGCSVMLSNSNTELVRKLYRHFNVQEVLASRAINCQGEKRGKISELIVRNYDEEGLLAKRIVDKRRLD
jgi:DNA adenine methylase